MRQKHLAFAYAVCNIRKGLEGGESYQKIRLFSTATAGYEPKEKGDVNTASRSDFCFFETKKKNQYPFATYLKPHILRPDARSAERSGKTQRKLACNLAFIAFHKAVILKNAETRSRRHPRCV